MFKISVLRFTEKEKTKVLKTYLVTNKEELFQDCGIQLSDDEFNKVITEPYLEFENVGFIGTKVTLEEFNRVSISEQKANQYYSEMRYTGEVNGLHGNAILVELEINEKQRIEIDYEDIIKFNHLAITVEEFKSLSTQQIREHVVDYVIMNGDIEKPDWIIVKIELT